MARTFRVIDYTNALRVIQAIPDRVMRAKVASLVAWDASEHRDSLQAINDIAKTMRPCDVHCEIKPHILRATLVLCGYSDDEANGRIK